jgi:hypothetical protein
MQLYQTATLHPATDHINESDCDVTFRYWSISFIRLRCYIPLLINSAHQTATVNSATDVVSFPPLKAMPLVLFIQSTRKAKYLQHLCRLCSTIQGDAAVDAKGRVLITPVP